MLVSPDATLLNASSKHKFDFTNHCALVLLLSARLQIFRFFLRPPRLPQLSFSTGDPGLLQSNLAEHCLVDVVGLEPTTAGAKIRCSKQLSYTSIFGSGGWGRTSIVFRHGLTARCITVLPLQNFLVTVVTYNSTLLPRFNWRRRREWNPLDTDRQSAAHPICLNALCT